LGQEPRSVTARPVRSGRRLSRESLAEEVLSSTVTIIGAGLAGSEAALSLAARGHRVRLLEQKPKERTPAQTSDQFCELVCSNSFRGAALSNAVGLLKQEMRLLGSFVMRAADEARVPAGGALAVDRDRFSEIMTRRLRSTPEIEIVAERVDALPVERPLLVATGPLTADGLARDIARRVGSEHLAYYDAIAPIVSADSIDWDEVFMASRWDKGSTVDDQRAYVNCPLDRARYEHFVAELLAAQKVQPKSFEDVRYFEGCLPIEVMAERGPRTLAFGPMKPVGLTDPRTGRWPHAVVQLRSEDVARTAYNMVGFQTRLTWGEQQRIFRQLPGLAHAEFLRYGAIHRNTFLNAPRLLGPDMSLSCEPGVYFAGQITGSEGYVEGAASGWLAAWFIARALEGRPVALPPPESAHGGLLTQLGRSPDDYQPSNVTFSHLPPWQGRRLPKRTKYEAMAARALTRLRDWMGEHGLSPGLAPDDLLIVPGLAALPPEPQAAGVVVAPTPHEEVASS
jgi:methylenetetrahydrofolate--tRNA-(uracil-5-)-methyltransferase